MRSFRIPGVVLGVALAALLSVSAPARADGGLRFGGGGAFFGDGFALRFGTAPAPGWGPGWTGGRWEHRGWPGVGVPFGEAPFYGWNRPWPPVAQPHFPRERVVVDRFGRPIGTAQRDPFGNLVLRDPWGGVRGVIPRR